MIVAHLSDLHLGHRAFDRQERGRNVRERDVESAFEKALVAVTDLAPGLVVVSGDVFDRPDPPSTAVVALAQGLERLREALPRVPVVMVAGSNDTALRAGGHGTLLAFDTIPGVEAAHGEVRTVRLLEGELHACLVPHRALLRRPLPEIRPDPDARWNVLVARARAARPGTGFVLDAGAGTALEIDLDDWDYVALGHSHGHDVLAPRAAYAGSLERIGPDPWREAADEKGFVTCDLATGRIQFHPIPGRAVVELAGIRIRPEDPEHVSRRIREVVRETPGGIDDKIVRMRIKGLPGGAAPKLDEALLATLQARALHLAVWVDWPSERLSDSTAGERLESRSLDGKDDQLLSGLLTDLGAGGVP